MRCQILKLPKTLMLNDPTLFFVDKNGTILNKFVELFGMKKILEV